MKKFLPTAFILSILLIIPSLTSAAPFPKLKYAGWIPYWKKTNGAVETTNHLNIFNQISPFSYEVGSDGILIDKLKISQDPWPQLFELSRSKKIKILPSTLWNDGEAIHQTLSSSTLRKAHINQVVNVVIENNFDGIDLDYENKKAETRPFFSRFVRELATELHRRKKILSCTIEPRTPLNSRFRVIPKDIKYANDYQVLNRYCNLVQIIAYDQGTIDLLLNQKKGKDKPYTPIADSDWVKKVIGETIKTISPKKIMLGVATFGYEYELSQEGKTYFYDKTGSLNYKEAMEIAEKAGVRPLRNLAGELSFTYTATTTIGSSNIASIRLVWFSDAKAIEDKIKLARTYGLRGISIFKLDGGTDPALWNKLK